MNNKNSNTNYPRRKFVSMMGKGALLSFAGNAFSNQARAAEGLLKTGKAKNCITIWLAGGMGQIDTFDPKKVGVPKENVAGSAYPSIATNVPDVRVCEHLKKCATLMDRMTAVRTVHHDVIDEHAAAVIRVHTGRPSSGTIQYPSIGSIVARRLGAVDPLVPSYVVIGNPSIARDPGFLGPLYGYLYVTDAEAGPNGLSRPSYITEAQKKRRERLLGNLRKSADMPKYVEPYDDMLTRSLKLAGPGFMGAFDLSKEKTAVRESYGGEFGQRCLLARRLVDRGVRFVELTHNQNFSNGTGWDVHFDGLANQHVLINELDQGLSALIRDLDEKGTLDETLICVGTEFGRPAGFDSGGGRGHHGRCFSLVLAGGGMKHRGAYGVTDDLAENIVENPVSVPDFHATMLAAMSIDPTSELYTSDGRPVPVTDGGMAISALLG